MFKTFFTIKRIWDRLPVFTQETIYHVRTETRQSLIMQHHPRRPTRHSAQSSYPETGLSAITLPAKTFHLSDES